MVLSLDFTQNETGMLEIAVLSLDFDRNETEKYELLILGLNSFLNETEKDESQYLSPDFSLNRMIMLSGNGKRINPLTLPPTAGDFHVN